MDPVSAPLTPTHPFQEELPPSPLPGPAAISVSLGRPCESPTIQIHDGVVLARIDSVWERFIGPGLQQLVEREPQGIRADSLLGILDRVLRITEGNLKVIEVDQEVEKLCSEYLQTCTQIEPLRKQLFDTEFGDGSARSFYNKSRLILWIWDKFYCRFLRSDVMTMLCERNP